MGVKKLIRRSYGWWKSQQIKHSTEGYQQSVLLAGSARSGTTWLAELINHEAHFRYIFEPFNKTEVKLCQDFEERQYLVPERIVPAFQDILEHILLGKIRNHWTDFYNTNTTNSHRLIKCIRANLLLEYIHHNFPEVPIIFLLRHPFAVAYSRMKLGWSAPLASLFRQKELHAKHLLPYQDLLDDATSDFEQQVLFWCLENQIPILALEQQTNFQLVHYEQLVQAPEKNIRQIFDFLNLAYDPTILIPFTKASQSVKVHNPQRSLDSWKENIPKEAIEKGLRILKKTGMDRFYQRQILPLI